jgi:DNA segregation ATPase FtsK/SpoIIIE-like protein
MVDTFINEELLKHGYVRYIPWKLTDPHALIVGSSGSGKSYASLLLLSRLSLYLNDLRLVVCDYKGDNCFGFLEGQSNFYRYDKCVKGIDRFYEAFKLRQSGKDTCDNYHIMFIDEYSSLILSLPKAEAEALKTKIAQIMFMGRSMRFLLIVSMQRCDSSYFPNGARENFSMTICVGSMAPELRDMAFYNFKEAVKAPKQRGHGYLLMNGTDLYHILIPEITSMEKVKLCILKTIGNIE